MKNKKKQIIITLIAIISLIVITVGVTYAFFNYAKEGTTDNTIKTGTITFLYTEVSGVGLLTPVCLFENLLKISNKSNWF